MTITLFLYLFKIKDSPNYENGSGVLSLRQHIWYFEAYCKSMTDFDDHFYLVTPMTKEAHANIYRLEPNPASTCSNVFHKYWTKSHYLTRFGLYSYKEEDMSLEE